MTPSYKLYYGDGKGAGEAIRYLFKYANIEFEDVRIKMEEWPKYKETFPYGQVPVLEHNGKKINQSIAIARYVGRLAKLGGNDDWENLQIDAIVYTINDLKQKVAPVIMERDETKKKELIKTCLEETLPYYFSKIEKIASANNGYLALGKLTWADIYFVGGISYFEKIEKDFLGKYPTLQAIVKKVESIPAIKRWIEIRPETEF